MKDDVISRQGAIDAFKKELTVGESKGNYVTICSAVGYEGAKQILESLPSAQPEILACGEGELISNQDVPDINVGDINKFIDGLVEIFADIRESNVDDSVCGLCEFDGAYIGESGDWCNECPGFNRDDCFKLRDGIRKKWIAEITACMPSAQPEPCGDVVSRNAIIQKLNTMDRYVSEELRLCDTDKKFPQNEVFIVDDVYEEIVEQLPSAQPETNCSEFPNNSDTISRQAAIDAVEALAYHADKYVIDSDVHEVHGFRTGLAVAERQLSLVPSAQPERKMGKWIKLDAHAHLADHKCSACGQECYVPTCMGDPMYDYCPNCGARMKEGEEHD